MARIRELLLKVSEVDVTGYIALDTFWSFDVDSKSMKVWRE